MPIFLKENNALKDNMYEIPKDLEVHLKNTLSKFSDYHQNKGYKRLNTLVNPKYNKRSDKEDRLHSNKKHISFSDLKRIDHDFRHMNQNPHDIQRQMNGGDKMAKFVHDTLSKERTKVEPTLKQEKVKSLEKNKLKPSISEPSTISVGNLSAQVHESNKKIYIKESQINILNEYRNQLTLPFDGEGKYNYEHFVDYLEEIGKYGNLEQTQDPNIENYVNKNIQSAFLNYIDSFDYTDEGLLPKFIEFIDNNQKDLPKLFKIQYYREYLEDEDGLEDLMNYYLSEYGEKKWKDYMFQVFEDDINSFGFPYGVKQNERGLIYVERVITMPNILKKDFNHTYDNGNDYYKHLMQLYSNGVGVYWSWLEGDAYCGGGYSDGQKIKLMGYVDPKSIDWDETISKQAYSLAEEREIQIKKGEPIEIFSVITTNGKKFPLQNTIIVKA